MQILLFACWGLICWLLLQDRLWRQRGSWALLIPGGWLAVQGSRPLSYWLGGGGGGDSHPINTLWYALILIATLIILARRGIVWSAFISRNKALVAIYCYLFLSMLWSESPADSLKRVIKDFEAVLVALVLLSEKDAGAAIKIVFVRVSYILFPLSAVLIKYFPAIGRNATRAGENMFTGVTTQKNSLGLLVFVLSLVIIWDFIALGKTNQQPGKLLQIWIRIGMLGMGLWLLKICDSQTSLICLVLGAAMIWICGKLVRMRNGKSIFVAGLALVAACAIADEFLGISNALLAAMGRDPTLTGRTEIWKAVLAQPIDSLFGNGFWVFWYSDKGASVIDELLLINSAHSGYLEMYLDGGLIGVTLLIWLLLTMAGRSVGRLFQGHPLGTLAVTFWIVAIPYNMSESSFFRMDVLWFTLLLLTTECTFRMQAFKEVRAFSNDIAHRREFFR